MSNIDYSHGLLISPELGAQRLSQDFSQDFSGKTFKFIANTQFEAHLQRQAAEVGCSALEKTSIIGRGILLFLVADFKEF